MRNEKSCDAIYTIKIKSQNDFDKLNSLFNIYIVDDNFINWAVCGIRFAEDKSNGDIPKDMELCIAEYNRNYISIDNFENGYPYKITNKITSEQFIGTFNDNIGPLYELSFSTIAIVDECKNIRIEDIDKGIYEIKDMNDDIIQSSELTPILGYNPFLPDYADESNDEINIPCILLDKKGNMLFTILSFISIDYILFNSEDICNDTKYFEISASDLKRNYKVYLAHEDVLNKLFNVNIFSNDLFKLNDSTFCIERWYY
jgi:hypothetical protein